MRSRSIAIGVVAFLCGTVWSVLVFDQFGQVAGHLSVAHAQASDPKPTVDVATMQADVERLKTYVVETTAMRDVDHNTQSLWFAGRASNWPLATYYWEKTLLHMRLAAEINPTRKDNAGRQVPLKDILQSIEQSPQMQVGQAIQKHDLATFRKAYEFLLEGCYGCHKAADKPFLRPRIPAPPAQSIINVDPKATWPK